MRLVFGSCILPKLLWRRCQLLWVLLLLLLSSAGSQRPCSIPSWLGQTTIPDLTNFKSRLEGQGADQTLTLRDSDRPGHGPEFPDNVEISETIPRVGDQPSDEKGGRSPPTPVWICNSLEGIQMEDEYLKHPQYHLQALAILTRHGDRGPLAPTRHNISHVDCSYQTFLPSPLSKDLNNFIKFTKTMSRLPGYLKFIGPFNSFPKAPTSSTCELNQLTKLGSTQLIQLGKLIRETYPVELFSRNDSQSQIIAYSTRFRRTLQSLLSFLFGMLGPKSIVTNVKLKESKSMAFCFNDCCTPAKKLGQTARPSPVDELEMAQLGKKVKKVLGVSTKRDVRLLDLLLVYVCHNESLPCQLPKNPKNHTHSDWESRSRNCITAKDVTSLISLLQKGSLGNKDYHYSLLNGYGLLKEILNFGLETSSPSSGDIGNDDSRNSRVTLFSGHDVTLQILLGALGIDAGHPDLILPPYASRFIFEFYKKIVNATSDSVETHFRAIYNGLAVTHLISFCKAQFKSQFNDADELIKDKCALKLFLCPLQNMVTFLHYGYLDSLKMTSTNFKDACQRRSADASFV